MTRRRGLVLIIVLVVIVFLSLGAYTFTDLMLTHHESAQLAGRHLQTRYLADSGVEYVKQFLAQTEDARLEAGGVFDNASAFRGRLVVPDDDPNRRGSFAVENFGKEIRWQRPARSSFPVGQPAPLSQLHQGDEIGADRR